MLNVLILLFLASLAVLVVGVLNPSIIFRKGNIGRKKAAAIFGGLTIVFFILIGVFAPTPTPATKGASTNTLPTSVPITEGPTSTPVEIASPSTAVATPTPTLTPTSIPTLKPTTVPTEKPTNVVITPKPTAVSTVAPTSAPAAVNNTGSNGGFSCNCAKTCPQMASCSEAQYQLNMCGCSQRDADHDGIACDSDCQ